MWSRSRKSTAEGASMVQGTTAAGRHGRRRRGQRSSARGSLLAAAVILFPSSTLAAASSSVSDNYIGNDRITVSDGSAGSFSSAEEPPSVVAARGGVRRRRPNPAATAEATFGDAAGVVVVGFGDVVGDVASEAFREPGEPPSHRLLDRRGRQRDLLRASDGSAAAAAAPAPSSVPASRENDSRRAAGGDYDGGGGGGVAPLQSTRLVQAVPDATQTTKKKKKKNAKKKNQQGNKKKKRQGNKKKNRGTKKNAKARAGTKKNGGGGGGGGGGGTKGQTGGGGNGTGGKKGADPVANEPASTLQAVKTTSGGTIWTSDGGGESPSPPTADNGAAVPGRCTPLKAFVTPDGICRRHKSCDPDAAPGTQGNRCPADSLCMASPECVHIREPPPKASSSSSPSLAQQGRPGTGGGGLWRCTPPDEAAAGWTHDDVCRQSRPCDPNSGSSGGTASTPCGAGLECRHHSRCADDAATGGGGLMNMAAPGSAVAQTDGGQGVPHSLPYASSGQGGAAAALSAAQLSSPPTQYRCAEQSQVAGKSYLNPTPEICNFIVCGGSNNRVCEQYGPTLTCVAVRGC